MTTHVILNPIDSEQRPDGPREISPSRTLAPTGKPYAWQLSTPENPELVAQRLERYAALVGKENVMAGTDCGMGYAVDLKNGNVVPLPVGGEANSDMELEYHPESRLLKASWKGAANDYSGPPADCTGFGYFEWTGSEFKTLKASPHSAACE